MFMVLSWIITIAPSLTIPILVGAYGRVSKAKRSQMRRLFRPGSTLEKIYLTAFPDQDNKSGASNGTKALHPVDVLFNAEYHWLAYVPPTILVFLVTLGFSIVGFTALGFSLLLPAEAEALFKEMPGTVIAGLAGAYIWVIYELLRRFSVADLNPSVIYLASVRIALGGVLGFLVTTVVNESVALLIAFGLGAFPSGTLQSILKEQVSTRLEQRLDGTQGESPTLQCIQGVTPRMAERLVEEGIDSTEALAYANPVNLLLRTNLEFKVILDLIDQAFLYNYVGGRVDKLRQVGIRAATDLTDIQELLESPDNTDDQKLGQSMLEPIAKVLEMRPDQVRNLIITFRYDPQIDLIIWLWGETKLNGE
jgi:hypothetical protein